MPLPLKPLSLKFRSEVGQAKNIFDREVLNAKSFERDLLIEACFLKCVIIWEEFIENYTLTCLCEGEIRPGVVIKPKRGHPISVSLLDAFKSLKSSRPDWSTHYYDWLKPSSLEEKILTRFDSRSRLQSIYLDTIKHDRMITVRNAIAHSSRKTIKLLETLYINLNGALPYSATGVRPADFLIDLDAHGKSYFHVLLDFYLYLEMKLMR
ncbi:hypothetical protein [Mucilaginibacter myungsuensis]|uniref:RiboL-PSP-HEPN domain-containing protein n=1 Tax=Mucilaginibacter myungsuensis TaxID=649104 RepID=A0A929KSJ3_9SPHI|nr:hypothetical protein [Mucilaginibacter myungsuensis]MBE9660731.1 hypothetical protein [Mucilaginibacter myungsuensis]MDN3600776.1 hypothetical protein [Mucilaginibacter myungsuensis]